VGLAGELTLELVAHVHGLFGRREDFFDFPLPDLLSEAEMTAGKLIDPAQVELMTFDVVIHCFLTSMIPT
jgi:hypothetical protein